PGAEFLNDVTAAADGTIYVSDSKTKAIHKVENDKASVYLTNLQAPNGVLAWNKTFYLLDKGALYKVGDGKKLIKIAGALDGNADGLEHVAGDDFLATCWEGSVYYVKGDGTVEKLLDTRDQKINSADIGYDAKNKIVYVPTFFKNSVVAYQLQ
ncbi:MAG: ATP/GTP-binding protein, partial [Chitinophagaceae bacterium]|nr:ATP/GTP-binding protein [Chitinophagaceae bacterium]